MNKIITSREDILNASRDIARAKGLPAINMRGVAKDCGVSVGSVYNYFPSKAELVAATVESVWESIFHAGGHCSEDESFIGTVEWFFNTVKRGSEDYPAFFTLHAMGFKTGDRQAGERVMNKFFVHMQQGLLHALEKDKEVRPDAFNEHFTKEEFVGYVFSNVLMLRMNEAKSCALLAEMIKRAVY